LAGVSGSFEDQAATSWPHDGPCFRALGSGESRGDPRTHEAPAHAVSTQPGYRGNYVDVRIAFFPSLVFTVVREI